MEAIRTIQNTTSHSYKINNKDTIEKYVIKDSSLIKSESLEDVSIKNKINQLKQREQAIIKHEKTHMMIGGNLASNPTYIYTNGPDGKKYISGGQVNMKMPTATSLEALISGLKRIKSAASAVSDPSGADIAISSAAASIESAVKNEIALRKLKDSYINKNQMITKTYKSNGNRLDDMIENSYVSKLSQMKYKVYSKFELLI